MYTTFFKLLNFKVDKIKKHNNIFMLFYVDVM